MKWLLGFVGFAAISGAAVWIWHLIFRRPAPKKDVNQRLEKRPVTEVKKRAPDFANRDLADPAQAFTDLFGRLEMRLFPLPSDGPGHNLIMNVDTRTRDIYDRIAAQYERETDLASNKLDSADSNNRGVFILSQRFRAGYPIAAGAAGFNRHGDTWYLAWIWIHPYERGRGLIDKMWPEFERQFGDFHIRGPLSKPMKVIVEKMRVDGVRLDVPKEGMLGVVLRPRKVISPAAISGQSFRWRSQRRHRN